MRYRLEIDLLRHTDDAKTTHLNRPHCQAVDFVDPSSFWKSSFAVILMFSSISMPCIRESMSGPCLRLGVETASFAFMARSIFENASLK